MGKSGLRKLPKAAVTSEGYESLAAWKQAFLPGVADQEARQLLRQDAKNLAIALANDAFEGVRHRQTG